MVITYYKSQQDVAQALKVLIDDYWEGKLEENMFIESLSHVVTHNRDKIFKENQFTAILCQRLGKRRMELIEKIMREGTE